MVKVQEVYGHKRVAIPKVSCDSKGWKGGTILYFSIYQNGDVVLKEV